MEVKNVLNSNPVDVKEVKNMESVLLNSANLYEKPELMDFSTFLKSDVMAAKPIRVQEIVINIV